MRFDENVGNERVLIFGSDRCIRFLSTNQHWGADGTFYVVPNLFEQLWIVFGRLHKIFIPAIFVLMTNRTEESYQFVIQKLADLMPGLLIESVATDFELAEIKAFKVFIIITKKNLKFNI